MARSDLILDLVRAGTHGDQARFRKTVEAIAAEERAKQHGVLADRLEASVQQSGSGVPFAALRPPVSGGDVVDEVLPRRRMEELVLPEVVSGACRELIEEQQRADLLRSHNLEPRHRVLLSGPPGGGKTTLAEALATELSVPLLVVRYEAVIGSFLGETAVRVARVFERARARQCVLFLDEFDVLGKERGDLHETGEIKRVVSSLLLQVDALPSYVVVVTATNHAELLDRAVWRRFQLRLSLPSPTTVLIKAWLVRFEASMGESLGSDPGKLARQLRGLSFAELEEFCSDVRRRRVLALPEADLPRLVRERLRQWKDRSGPPTTVVNEDGDG